MGTIRIDAAGIIRDIAANRFDYGLSNVTAAYLETGGDPSDFLFWDAVHPTTRGHRAVAEEAIMILRDDLRHPWGTPRHGNRHYYSFRGEERERSRR